MTRKLPLCRLWSIPLLTALLFTGLARAEEETPLKEGDKAPEFSVQTDASAKPLELTGLRGKRVVLVFSRANWCPYCMAQLKEIQDQYEAIQGQNAEVVVIFREELTGVEGLQKIRSMTDAKMPLALDLHGEKTGRYSSEGYTTYILDKQGVITKILTGTKTERPTGEAILQALRQ